MLIRSLTERAKRSGRATGRGPSRRGSSGRPSRARPLCPLPQPLARLLQRTQPDCEPGQITPPSPQGLTAQTASSPPRRRDDLVLFDCRPAESNAASEATQTSAYPSEPAPTEPVHADHLHPPVPLRPPPTVNPPPHLVLRVGDHRRPSDVVSYPLSAPRRGALYLRQARDEPGRQPVCPVHCTST